jgi:DNA polymerase III epsilon subunit-like protein
MTSFIVIDFETAHPQTRSICQVGLVRVENQIKSPHALSDTIACPKLFNLYLLRNKK